MSPRPKKTADAGKPQENTDTPKNKGGRPKGVGSALDNKLRVAELALQYLKLKVTHPSTPPEERQRLLDILNDIVDTLDPQ